MIIVKATLEFPDIDEYGNIVVVLLHHIDELTTTIANERCIIHIDEENKDV